MKGPHVLDLETAPRYAYGVAAVLLLTIAFAILQVTFIQPALDPALRVPAGRIAQLLVFTVAAAVLFWVRSSDPTAALSVLALALSGIANAGPPRGVEWPVPLGDVAAGMASLAAPFAFPIIALAVLYFPSKAPLLARYRFLHIVPWIAASPMLVLGGARALWLWGVDALAPVVAWDDRHPWAFYASFSAALALNVAALVEGVYRYRFNHDANERRRIRMAVYTAVPGVLAYAVKEGLPVAASLAGGAPPSYPASLDLLLQALIPLPGFGVAYAVGVERVLGPRVVLRRSLQYALAKRTLRVLVLVPAIALITTLVHDRNERLGDIVTSRALVYLIILAALVCALRYRERAQQWLDQRFFREEYDARKILLSLASRVRFETDPTDLADIVVAQLDEALHPEAVAVMAAGLEDASFTTVASKGRPVDPLPGAGGIASMLRWSDEPLEIVLDDPRSSARRLPPSEQEWLERTGASLLVPVVGAAHELMAVIVLGEKRSEEPYTEEDRQLLASIATQVGLGFDVARLRRRTQAPVETDDLTTRVTTLEPPMVECPQCGRCEDAGTLRCPDDGAALAIVAAVPRVVDNKYRMEQLLGRGGMGAVYRARDMRLERQVAVKVVRAELLGDSEARQRFRREAQIVARLQHPSIVSIFDYGTFPDRGAYLVMELVRGEDLRRLLQRERRLDVGRATRILLAVCGAIEWAHREGVLHRDLKPENILLPNGGVDAKVLDFGVAKIVQDERAPSTSGSRSHELVTAPGIIVGTPAYVPPEQFHGATPDARGDVFSLGVVAYEMLTGELPFGRGSLADIVLAHARGAPELTAVGFPQGIGEAIHSALEVDPAKRPPSIQAFAQQLGGSRVR